MVKIDGKAFSQVILEKIREEHNQLKEKYGKQAGLAVVIVGNNPASQVYVRNKMKACENVGFYSENIELDENISEKELLQEIDKLNKNDRINGILVQLPLPSHINELKIIDSISPETGFISCTPYGIMQLLEEYKIEIAGKDAVIIGRSNIVGKPMALMLIQKGATVQVCNSRTKDLRKKLNDADFIIVAAGVPKLLKKEDVKEGAVVIDVGINRVDGKICGDVDYEEVVEKASYITPVPGGVGPMTIASLIKNTFKSYKNSLK